MSVAMAISLLESWKGAKKTHVNEIKAKGIEEATIKTSTN
jgi:hypothetical protein